MEKCNTQENDMATTANNWKKPGASNPGRYRIVLETMLIEEILILDRSLVIPLIIMEIPIIILMEILIRCPMILKIV